MQKLPLNLYRAAQARELDRIAIQERGIPGFDLMDRAGYEVFYHIKEQWPNAQSLAVFCGGGNNAGDGYIIARLALDAGLKVVVYSVLDPSNLKGYARTAHLNYVGLKGVIVPFHSDVVINADLIVDALLGTGLDRPVTGVYAQAIALINQSPAPVIAVDCPSGLNADTGNVLGCAVRADSTVTFIALKQGLFTGQAADYCGSIRYTSLAVPESIFKAIPPSAVRVVKKTMPRRAKCSHKGNYGHVLIIGGEAGYTGAAMLAGEAALRMGAGLVSIATRPAHAAVMNLGRPELMCHGVETTRQLSDLMAKATVVVLGPGLGESNWAKSMFTATVSVKVPLLIDADGLNLLGRLPISKSDLILTPHPGEAGRLLDCPTEQILQDRFAAATAIQARHGGVIVLKGAGTIIATQDSIAVSNTGNPGMASGGMGDVLSGVIASLVAQGMPLKDAAEQGVYRHGQAADMAAEKDGERGLLASDLMPYLRSSR
ncbi:MAG: NAD(P)H-hydrate dehydratase [Methylococcales bacterium]|nr:NAD(P)H-hydrate dehydratase [Methylococcales bacterium]